jgi:hypothetical protein
MRPMNEHEFSTLCAINSANIRLKRAQYCVGMGYLFILLGVFSPHDPLVPNLGPFVAAAFFILLGLIFNEFSPNMDQISVLTGEVTLAKYEGQRALIFKQKDTSEELYLLEPGRDCCDYIFEALKAALPKKTFTELQYQSAFVLDFELTLDQPSTGTKVHSVGKLGVGLSGFDIMELVSGKHLEIVKGEIKEQMATEVPLDIFDAIATIPFSSGLYVSECGRVVATVITASVEM